MGQPKVALPYRAPTSGHRMQYGSKNTRSPTAISGINLLRKGSEAIKVTRSGKSRLTKFRLSDDEQTLSWDGGHGGLATPVKIARGERRHIKITEILDIMLGMESKIFSLHKTTAGSNEPMAHLSMTLVLIGSLPSFPGDEKAKGDRRNSAELRETLDLTFTDEEIFGLWVAALRALMQETEPVFFAKVASPLNNVTASAVDSIKQSAPPDASCGELLRDKILLFLLTKCSQVLNLVWIICVAGCGTWWMTTIMGWWDSFYIIYPLNCSLASCKVLIDPNKPFYLGKVHYANIAIQIVRGLLTYQCIFMVGAWRFSNLWHLTCSRRESEAGHDLYGRSTEASWFQIEKKKRLRVTLLLIGNIVFQIFLQIAAICFYSYELDQEAAGFAVGLAMMLCSISCAVAGGIYSMIYEHELHTKEPNKFPPNPIMHALERLNRKRKKYNARQFILREMEYVRMHRANLKGADSAESPGKISPRPEDGDVEQTKDASNYDIEAADGAGQGQRLKGREQSSSLLQGAVRSDENPEHEPQKPNEEQG